METELSKDAIDFDFFDDGSGKEANSSENRPKNGVRHLSKESLSQHNEAMLVSDNTRPSSHTETNGRVTLETVSCSGSHKPSSSIEKSNSESDSDDERTARTVSSRSTNISVKVPSALDNVSHSESESDGESTGESRASDDDRENNNVKINKRDKITRSKNPEPTDIVADAEKKGPPNNIRPRPRTAKAGRKHNDSWTSEDVSDRNPSESDHSRTFSSSETDSNSTSSDSDSDTSVTDVSPLHSPDRSKKYEEIDRSFEKKQRSSKDGNRKADGVRFVEVTPGYSIHGKSKQRSQDLEARELSMLLRAVLEMDECPTRNDFESLQRKMNRPSSGRPKRGRQRPESAHLPHQRMNMSFSNDEVQRIDRENRRLLGKIMTNKAQVPSTRNLQGMPGQRMSHAAMRRQREQRRIEMENMVSVIKLEG